MQRRVAIAIGRIHVGPRCEQSLKQREVDRAAALLTGEMNGRRARVVAQVEARRWVHAEERAHELNVVAAHGVVEDRVAFLRVGWNMGSRHSGDSEELD